MADDFLDDETDGEKEARASLDDELDELSREFVEDLLDRLLLVTDELSGNPLYPYQRPFARRIFESLITGDGAALTALFSRQSGKSETVANTVATAMILFPSLAIAYPDLLGKFRKGLWVGAFAPVEDQAENLYSRIVSRLTSEQAVALMSDPDLNIRIAGKGRTLSLSNGSLVRRQTAHPRAIIEGRTYHLILMDEAQGVDARMLFKSISPMGASTNATLVLTGTPSYEKGAFYKLIQDNKREQLGRGKKPLHFQADWREAAKANPSYKKYVSKEMIRIGEDSDEFKLSYRLIWLLEQGMFTTEERLESLGDKSMKVEHTWHRTPVVIGIDPARKQDSTIVTVVHVDWDRPDENGIYPHRILNWLDLTGQDWERQYERITDFCANYKIMKVGIDAGGLGDVVASRLRVLMPHTEIEELGSDRASQSKRWKHLANLMDRGLITWPAHAKTRETKLWRRFHQQMTSLEKVFAGPYLMAEAPKEPNAHDDFADSLAMACVLTLDYAVPTVQFSDNPFYRRRY
ncbi:hypothetical protein FDA94_29280 [Herbidospora galbida]|uniref:Terminase large subunit gp17-like C-terminal domain-containing protein n=1 Tax=Herbidospora galbida TaxID=2575442 RepID=A0A4U3M6Y7_9ACTN|nr:hypothetical protein [Herbidospora galbida]TKK84708.1 hypothetical protein FDA94_29280 [Herbidospora galbida]